MHMLIGQPCFAEIELVRISVVLRWFATKRFCASAFRPCRSGSPTGWVLTTSCPQSRTGRTAKSRCTGRRTQPGNTRFEPRIATHKLNKQSNNQSNQQSKSRRTDRSDSLYLHQPRKSCCLFVQSIFPSREIIKTVIQASSLHHCFGARNF